MYRRINQLLQLNIGSAGMNNCDKSSVNELNMNLVN